MTFKLFDYSILNNSTVQPNIIFKKQLLVRICSNSLYLIHRLKFTKQTFQKLAFCSTKTRSEVRGGGRKPWKQKGTGNARIGSIRSPLKRGGGKSFGPKPHIKKNKINKDEKSLFFKTLLYNNRFKYLIFHTLTSTSPKLQILKYFHFKTKKKISVLVLLETKNLFLHFAHQNISNYTYSLSSKISITLFLRMQSIILTFSSFLNLYNR